MPDPRRFGNLLVCATFSAALLAPMIGHQSLPAVATAATRGIAESEKVFGSGFPQWRSWTRAYHEVRWNVFGALNRAVQIGSDGWLYFRWDSSWRDRTPFQDFLGLNRGQPQDRSRWAKTMAKRKTLVESLGAIYLPFVAPNKETVCPEHLPAWIACRRSPATRLDDVLATLRGPDLPHMLDLRPALLLGKSQTEIYEKTDTHWNAWGAYCAYRAIVDRLGLVIRDQPISQAGLEFTTSTFSGDLTSLALLRHVFQEQSVCLRPLKTYPAVFDSDGLPTLAPGAHPPQWPEPQVQPRFLITHCDDPTLPTAVIFHDSFAIKLLPYLSQHFRRIYWDWKGFDQTVIERERPDVVIHLRVEVYLDWLME